MNDETRAAEGVVMYSSRYCPYCMMARRLLDQKGVEYDVIDVDGDRQARREMVERSGRTSVPQIFVGSVHVGGSDDLHALEHAGRLDALLAEQIG